MREFLINELQDRYILPRTGRSLNMGTTFFFNLSFHKVFIALISYHIWVTRWQAQYSKMHAKWRAEYLHCERNRTFWLGVISYNPWVLNTSLIEIHKTNTMRFRSRQRSYFKWIEWDRQISTAIYWQKQMTPWITILDRSLETLTSLRNLPYNPPICHLFP